MEQLFKNETGGATASLRVWQLSGCVFNKLVRALGWPNACIYIGHEDRVANVEPASAMGPPLDRCSFADPVRNGIRSRTE
jgi:hypothetical protein